MGLDNGLILHTKKKIPAKERPDFIKIMPSEIKEADFPYSYEICYWRKCWNIRKEVAHAIGAPHDYVAKYGLDVKDVKNIWRAVESLDSRRAWGSGSIWSYDEMSGHLNMDLISIEWLIHFMKDHDENDYAVEFYDSY